LKLPLSDFIATVAVQPWLSSIQRGSFTGRVSTDPELELPSIDLLLRISTSTGLIPFYPPSFTLALYLAVAYEGGLNT
jgi:hypothetical protein